MTYLLSTVDFTMPASTPDTQSCGVQSFPATFQFALLSFWFQPSVIGDYGTALQYGTFTGPITRGLQITTGFQSVNPGIAFQCGDGTTFGGVNVSAFFPNLNIANRNNLLISIDSVGQVFQAYMNDAVVTGSVTWFSANPIAVDSGCAGLLGIQFEGNPGPVDACMGDVYLGHTASFYDLSIQANRRKFIDGTGQPVDLGPTGSLPTGTAPEIYLSVRASDPHEILVNKGSGGANFTASAGFTPVLCAPPPVPPGVPIPLCGDVHTSTGFTAAWNQGSGGTPTGYDVQYRRQGTSDWTEIDDIVEQSIFIDGLLPSTVYEFQVLAFNNAGNSGFSSSAFCSTDAEAKPGIPAPFCGLFPVVSETIIEQPVPNSLGRWRGQVGINWQGMALVGDAFSNVIGLSDFDAFTEYGETMQFLITTPPLHEDRKRIFISRFEIEVEAGQGLPGLLGGFTAAWTPDPSGGTPTSYDLQYRQQGTVDWIPINGVTDTSVFIDNLPAATYEFQVLAVNGSGSSAFSASQFCGTNALSAPPRIMLDVSKDGGKTWQALQQFRSMGRIGEYIKRLRWLNLGQSRTWVFRLRCTDPVRRYIIGSYIDEYKGLG